jgi:hypothetical protein
METLTLKLLTEKLKEAPQSVLERVMDYFDDLMMSETVTNIPQWHKKIIDQRLENYKENPNSATDFDSFCDELEKKL